MVAERIIPWVAAAVLASGPALAEDCSSAGTRAFRTEGVDAAFAAFADARGRAECRGDAQLAFNYARSLQTVLDRDGDDARACDGADAYAQAATADALPGAVQAMAAEGRADMARRCEATRAAAEPTEDYETLVTRARDLVRTGDRAGAAALWKTASRQKPDAALPHRALCSLLPDLDRADEGRGHCRQWRALEPATAPAPPVSAAPDHTLTWVIAGAAALGAIGGGLLYGVALDAAGDARQAHDDAAAALEDRDPRAYASAGVALDEASGRAERAQVAAFALWGVGAALGGWAVWRLLDDGSTAAAVRIDGAGLSIHGSF